MVPSTPCTPQGKKIYTTVFVLYHSLCCLYTGVVCDVFFCVDGFALSTLQCIQDCKSYAIWGRHPGASCLIVDAFP